MTVAEPMTRTRRDALDAVRAAFAELATADPHGLAARLLPEFVDQVQNRIVDALKGHPSAGAVERFLMNHAHNKPNGFRG